ncbi:MAG: esterase family protein, partial [Bacteroidia bacterium]|nr:esterase family protein [Bacteroidia bacterium]
MQKVTLVLFLSMFISVSGFGQSGKVFDQLSHSSKILKTERNFAIYLPPDYETSQRSYPVLYLLHGAGDDQTGWVQFGEVLHIVDKAIKEGKATPMIIVMPDAKTTQLGYFNLVDGSWNYEDYFFKELMPYVEKTYRIKGEKRYRAIAGLSMGGGGTFVYAMRRPDLFSAACPLSAYTGPTSVEQAISDNRLYFNVGTDPENAAKFIKEHSALELIKTLDKKTLNSLRWYIDCG